MKHAFSPVTAISLLMDQKNNYFPPYFFLPSFRKRRKYHRQQKCSQDGFRKTKGLFPLLLLLQLICILLSLLFFSSSQGIYLSTLAALILVENRPLALRGHVTNASFKQRVGILLMPKIVRAHKNYLTPEI